MTLVAVRNGASLVESLTTAASRVQVTRRMESAAATPAVGRAAVAPAGGRTPSSSAAASLCMRMSNSMQRHDNTSALLVGSDAGANIRRIVPCKDGRPQPVAQGQR